jgi:Uma2 family endonuclease
MATITPTETLILQAAHPDLPDAGTNALSPGIVLRLHRLTVLQFDQMVANGVIAEDDPVELIEGLLVTKMSRNRPHLVAGKKGLKVLSRIIPPGWHVAKEDPVVVLVWCKPEPDLAIVRGAGADYLDHDVTAADVALVIEIAESSHSIDQNDMARVYSSSRIPTYWIVNLVNRQLEVYTNPGPNGYETSQIFTAAHEVTVVIDGREVGRITVAEILP